MKALSNTLDVKRELKDEVKRKRKETIHKIVEKAQFIITRQVKLLSKSLQSSQVS